MRTYYPYKATDGKHKYYIITNANKKVYFGAVGYDDFTTHKDPLRKERYIARHKKKIGQEQALILPVGGLASTYGKPLRRNKHMQR